MREQPRKHAEGCSLRPGQQTVTAQGMPSGRAEPRQTGALVSFCGFSSVSAKRNCSDKEWGHGSWVNCSPAWWKFISNDFTVTYEKASDLPGGATESMVSSPALDILQTCSCWNRDLPGAGRLCLGSRTLKTRSSFQLPIQSSAKSYSSRPLGLEMHGAKVVPLCGAFLLLPLRRSQRSLSQLSFCGKNSTQMVLP